jgi:Transmembrane secretion effector
MKLPKKVPILLERDNASARLISIRSASERAASHGRWLADKEPSSFLRWFQRMGSYLAKSANMMRHSGNKPAPPDLGIFSPLRYAVFRRIWTASLLSNLGLLVLGVGAAWSMTKISSSTSMVALVQTSLMLPVALGSTPAGAIADMFDRRIVGLVALSIALAGSISLSVRLWCK